jgi:hypothetical protein
MRGLLLLISGAKLQAHELAKRCLTEWSSTLSKSLHANNFVNHQSISSSDFGAPDDGLVPFFAPT